MKVGMFYLALFNALAAGLLYAMENSGWVLNALWMVVILVDSLCDSIKGRE